MRSARAALAADPGVLRTEARSEREDADLPHDLACACAPPGHGEKGEATELRS